jgi:hypothetical protein
VDAKVWDRLSESKLTTQNFDAERFNLKNLNNAGVKEEYPTKISKQACIFGQLE